MSLERKSTRRSALANLKATNTTNVGLWLDKFIANQSSEDKESKRILVSEVAGIIIPEEVYKPFYRQWRKSLESYGAELREAKVKGRMVVGLGHESVLETSITLHRIYGVPYIPGSALKGLAASYARQQLSGEWGKDGSAYKTIFGDMGEAGYITFFDALYVPGSGHNGKPLFPDVLSVHHQKYYQNQAGAPPADWDEPIPVAFLSATGRYLIGLAGPTAWVESAFEILQLGLAEYGIGGKTSSGYGRMELLPRPPKLVDPDQQKADELIRRVMAIPDNKVASEIGQRVQEWRTLQADQLQKRRIAQAIINKVRDAGREKASADRAWYKELLASL